MKLDTLPIVALVALGTAAPLVSKIARDNTNEPCATISSLVSTFYSNDSNASEAFYFDPELANACLLSSTIDNVLAESYVHELKKYMEFQSSIAYLKVPPENYPYAPLDLLGELEVIATKVALSGYRSQYLLDQALNDLFQSTHEGHISVSFCASSKILFTRSVDIVSVAVSNTSLPYLYIYEDIASECECEAPSHIVSINGQEAVSYLEHDALSQGFDPDASYNALLWSRGRVPFAATPLASGFRDLSYYPGLWTNVTFANGTTVHFQTQAFVPPGVWSTDIKDGKSFTDFFCIAPAQAAEPSPTGSSNSTATSAVSSSATATPTPTSFPSLFPYNPVVADPNNQVAGYYMNGSAFEDTAVLWVGTFDQADPNFANPQTKDISFQNTTRDFLAVVRASGKKRIIIDLSGNPGGNAIMPDDLFRRFFPDIEPYTASRARVSNAADIWGQTIASIPDFALAFTAAEISGVDQVPDYKIFLDSTIFNWRVPLTTTLQPFTGWFSSLFPPNINHLDTFTANFRLPLNNSLYTELIDHIDVYGEEANLVTAPQPFKVEDIVIVTDGFCSSACAHFVELMTRQGGVKTVAVGGRPRIAPMQAIGGTKGSQAFHFSDLADITTSLVQNFSSYIPSHLLTLAADTLPGLAPMPLGDPSALQQSQLNLLDTVPAKGEGDDEEIPLQFVFEPADCRIWYAMDMILEPEKVWERVWEVTWGEGVCVWWKEGWRGGKEDCE